MANQPTRDAGKVADRLYEQFWKGKLNTKRHGCTVRDLLAIAIRAERAAWRRAIKHAEGYSEMQDGLEPYKGGRWINRDDLLATGRGRK